MDLSELARSLFGKIDCGYDHRKSFSSYQGHTFHYIVEDEVCFLAATVEGFPLRIVFAYLDRAKEEFFNKYAGTSKWKQYKMFLSEEMVCAVAFLYFLEALELCHPLSARALFYSFCRPGLSAILLAASGSHTPTATKLGVLWLRLFLIFSLTQPLHMHARTRTHTHTHIHPLSLSHSRAHVLFSGRNSTRTTRTPTRSATCRRRWMM
jgi:Regulated-SNARE-like domain